MCYHSAEDETSAIFLVLSISLGGVMRSFPHNVKVRHSKVRRIVHRRMLVWLQSICANIKALHLTLYRPQLAS